MQNNLETNCQKLFQEFFPCQTALSAMTSLVMATRFQKAQHSLMNLQHSRHWYRLPSTHQMQVLLMMYQRIPVTQLIHQNWCRLLSTHQMQVLLKRHQRIPVAQLMHPNSLSCTGPRLMVTASSCLWPPPPMSTLSLTLTPSPLAELGALLADTA